MVKAERESIRVAPCVALLLLMRWRRYYAKYFLQSAVWVLGVAGVVCWVIKLLGWQAAGSFLDPLLCTWPKVIQQCVQL